MKQVKLIIEREDELFEDQINEFLQKLTHHGWNLIDIKFSDCGWNLALVIYETN